MRHPEEKESEKEKVRAEEVLCGDERRLRTEITTRLTLPFHSLNPLAPSLDHSKTTTVGHKLPQPIMNSFKQKLYC